MKDWAMLYQDSGKKIFLNAKNKDYIQIVDVTLSGEQKVVIPRDVFLSLCDFVSKYDWEEDEKEWENFEEEFSGLI